MRPVLVLLAAGLAAHAQMQDNRDKQLSCDSYNNGNRSHSCEVRELNAASTGRLSVDAAPNGSITVKGWLQPDVLVRARVDAWAENDADARALVPQVQVTAAAGEVRATGPDNARRSGWAVSYEIFVPQASDLNLDTKNGSIHISDVRGRLEFRGTNGSVHLARLAGDVQGSTTNGSVHVELAGNTWDGNQLDVKTTNGSVTITVPPSYSAHLYTRTTNGRLRSDIPVTVSGRIDTRERDLNLGSGGPPIRVTTTNGGVHIVTP